MPPPVIERIADHAEWAGLYLLQPAGSGGGRFVGPRGMGPDERSAPPSPWGAARRDPTISIY